jgi:hypothetical protein
VVIFARRPDDGLLEPSALFLDEAGMVIPPVLRALNTQAFDTATRFVPTITGVATNTFRPGSIVPSPQIRAALRWIRAFQSSRMAGRVDVRSIDVSSDAVMVVSTEQGSEVTFAYQRFESQLARWWQVYQLGQSRSRALASLDLAVTNYVPALWLDATNSEPFSVRPAQPSPYRKKNV